MSGFRETFTKAEKDNVLGYDDSASLYFGGCILVCVVAPWTFYFISRIFRDPHRPRKGANEKHCACSFCQNALEQRRYETTTWKTRCFSWSFLVQLVVLTVLWVVLIQIIMAIRSTAQIQVFDPFEILNIDRSASSRDIRKAYRTLSLRYHPDKNLNDPTAAAKFIMITKAYEALTDEVAKENFAKYGNPDGPGVMKIGIGLPHFLIEEKYQLGILLALFTVLLIVVPAIFITYYQRQKRYAGNGVLLETLYICNSAIKETTRVKNLPEIFATSLESRECTRLRATDNQDMKPIIQQVDDYGKRQFPNSPPLAIRNYYLLLAHMQRLHDALSPALKEDLQALLRHTGLITQCITELAMYHGWIYTAQAAIELRRCLIQALGATDTSLLQIPHFTRDVVKHCLRGKNVTRDLQAFINQPAKDRKGLSDMTAEQLKDIETFIERVPRMSIKVVATVRGEAEVVEGDLLTLTVTLTRENLRPEERAGFVHAPYFPIEKQEEWWIFVQEKASGKLAGFAKSRNQERQFTEAIQFWAPRKGRWTYLILAMCDSYAGVDITEDITVQVLGATEAPRQIYVHPEDEALDQVPSLIEQVLGTGPAAVHSFGLGTGKANTSDDEGEDDDAYVGATLLNTPSLCFDRSSGS